MSVRVVLALGETASGGAGPVAVKVATTADDVERLRGEAERLRRAAHPGVVALVEAGPVDEGYQLSTAYAGDTLDRWHGTPAQAAELGAALAATLADLHGRGLVHGRVDASHVLVGLDGRPRLCGLADPGDATPADDVAAAGRLLAELAERSGPAGGRRPRRRRSAGATAALLALARRALDPVPTRRPSARALATAIAATVPAAAGHAPAPDARSATATDPGATGRPAVIPVGLGRASAAPTTAAHDGPAAVEHSGPAVAATGPVPPPPPPPPPPPRRPAPPAASRAGPPSRPPTAPRSRARTPRLAVAAATTVAVAGAVAGGALVARSAIPDNDRGATPTAAADEPEPRAEPARVDGRVVEVGGARWSLGEPGDVAALGDWDCDGAPSPALLRPATGDVFVFGEWSPEGRAPVTVRSTQNVPGGATVRAEPQGDCDALVVRSATGRDTVIAVDR